MLNHLRIRLPHGGHLADQLARIRELAANGPARIELVFPVRTIDTLAFTTNVATWVTDKCKADKQSPPFAKFFKNSPDGQVMSLWQCPRPGDPLWPENANYLRVSHYADETQHLVYNIVGLVHEYTLRATNVENANAKSCRAFFTGLGFEQDHRYFLGFVQSGQVTTKPGDRFALTIEDVSFQEPSPPAQVDLSDEDIRKAAGDIYRATKGYFNGADFPEVFRCEAAKYLDCEITDQDIIDHVRPLSSTLHQADSADEAALPHPYMVYRG
jgi:hypothetical protein